LVGFIDDVCILGRTSAEAVEHGMHVVAATDTHVEIRRDSHCLAGSQTCTISQGRIAEAH
jgi:hypothetical protein